MDYRTMAHKALQRARGVVEPVVQNVNSAQQLTADEAVARYDALHAGRPAELIAFAQRMAPGTNPLVAAHKYEQAMEAKRSNARN